jgi:hypothetical protein
MAINNGWLEKVPGAVGYNAGTIGVKKGCIM